MSKSVLLTRRRGPETATPFLVLHGKWGTLESAETLAGLLGPDALSIAVRAPRVQNQGGSGFTHGYFWTIGPDEKPELSTLGDALYQLELLLNETWTRYGGRKLGLLGEGQGGMVALVLAAFFPDRVGQVIAVDARLPDNLGDMPFAPSLAGVRLTLTDDTGAGAIEALGAEVCVVARDEIGVAAAS